MAIGPNEVVITDANYTQFINPVVDGEVKMHGLIPRNFQTHPQGYLAHAPSFNIPLIPESEWQSRLDAQKAAKAQLSDVRNRGMYGQPVPSRDQNGKGYSHSEDTEVLTEKGWVRWPDWNHTDLLASVNTVTGLMEFQAPTEWHAYEYDDEIYGSTNRRLDFAVTRNHRMLVRKWDEKHRTLSSAYTFQRADQLGWYVGMMHAPSGFVGTDIVEVMPEGELRTYDGDDFLALVAAVCSCGYAGGSESTWERVSFCCFDEERYPAYAALAKRVGFAEQPTRRGVFTAYRKGLANWFRANAYSGSGYRSTDKRIPNLVKWVSGRQINHFLTWFGDRNHKPGSQPCFYSSSKRMIDDLQELLLRVSKRGTVRARGPRRAVLENGKVIEGGPSFTLTVSETDRLCIDRRKHIETDHYKGLVYCATVPNGTLVTRRNGSVLISGNCWAHSGVSAHLVARAAMNEPYADLSAYAIACIIKNFRDEGGWGSEGVQFQSERGCPTSQFWPQQSMSRSNDNAETWKNAALHKYIQWMDLDPNQMKEQLVTCLLLGFPVVSDYNWWSHSVCAIDIESISPFHVRIWNSWGDSWSENGTGILQDRKAIPDAGVAAIVVSPSSI